MTNGFHYQHTFNRNISKYFINIKKTIKTLSLLVLLSTCSVDNDRA